MLNTRAIEHLLEELCVEYGLCVPSSAQKALVEETLEDAATFTTAVFRAEGLDPSTNKKLDTSVLQHVERACARAQARTN